MDMDTDLTENAVTNPDEMVAHALPVFSDDDDEFGIGSQLLQLGSGGDDDALSNNNQNESYGYNNNQAAPQQQSHPFNVDNHNRNNRNPNRKNDKEEVSDDDDSAMPDVNGAIQQPKIIGFPGPSNPPPQKVQAKANAQQSNFATSSNDNNNQYHNHNHNDNNYHKYGNQYHNHNHNDSNYNNNNNQYHNHNHHNNNNASNPQNTGHPQYQSQVQNFAPNAYSPQQVQSNLNTFNAQRKDYQQYDINNNNNNNNYQGGYDYTNASGQDLSNTNQSIQQYHGNINNNNNQQGLNNPQNTGNSAFALYQGQQQQNLNNYATFGNSAVQQPQLPQFPTFPTIENASLAHVSTSPAWTGNSPAPATTDMNHQANNDNGPIDFMQEFNQQNNNQNNNNNQHHGNQQFNMNDNNTNSNNNQNNSQFQQHSNDNTNSSSNNFNQHQQEYKQSQQPKPYNLKDMRERQSKIIGFRRCNNRVDVVWMRRDDNKKEEQDSISWGIYNRSTSKFERKGSAKSFKCKDDIDAIIGYSPKPDISVKKTHDQQARESDYTIYIKQNRQFCILFRGETVKRPLTWENAPEIANWETIYFNNQ